MQSNRLRYTVIRLLSVLLVALVLSGCATIVREHLSEYKQMHGTNPPIELTLAPTNTPLAVEEEAATPTEADVPAETAAPVETAAPAEETPLAEPTVLPTETPTDLPPPTATAIDTAGNTLPTVTPTAAAQQPTVTPRAAVARATATVTPTSRPTPVVVIPNGFTVQTDSVRGYSLALPRGYSLLDLRSAQFRNLANTVGMGGQMASLTEFLDSPAGQSVGILAASDLTGMIFGGLPTIAQVMVVDAKGASQDTAQVSINSLLTGQGGFLSNPVIETMENVTINNLPGVRATVTGTMSGSTRAMAGKVVGLLANDKFYVLMQLTEATKLTAKEAIFDQIIGTFRPE